MTRAATHRDRAVTKSVAGEGAHDAELAALIRRLAVQRPDILTDQPPLPVPRPRPVTEPHSRPGTDTPPALMADPDTGRLLTRDDFPVDPGALNHIAHLRALANGNRRPGDHWPTHTTPAFRAKMARPSLRRRTIRALTHAARAACMTIGAVTTTALPLACLLLLISPPPPG
ncbi:hypothetical protein HDA32_000269 [Spinactinospora alkalitolerans]|uniref:Uncharacterized protein n=1 Tax=Spinactinospora alkalitolerans TaxID=687207 RepID=A0A852TMH5_9ACTN|nr:hypothetical protein [Spinactinospora alkalitolerans]NYE45149.1 hypothetical protein [Spinactinospora alkalitolerans]